MCVSCANKAVDHKAWDGLDLDADLDLEDLGDHVDDIGLHYDGPDLDDLDIDDIGLDLDLDET